MNNERPGHALKSVSAKFMENGLPWRREEFSPSRVLIFLRRSPGRIDSPSRPTETCERNCAVNEAFNSWLFCVTTCIIGRPQTSECRALAAGKAQLRLRANLLFRVTPIVTHDSKMHQRHKSITIRLTSL